MILPAFSGFGEGFDAIRYRVLRQNENQLFLAPHPALRPYVAHYTFTHPAAQSAQPGLAAPQVLHLLPDVSGCFVFVLGQHKVTGHMWGATTQTVTVERDFNRSPVRFFVEFRPGGAQILTGVWADELTNRKFELSAVLPKLYDSIMTLLEELLSGHIELEALLRRIDMLLLTRLKNKPAEILVSGLLPLLAQGEAASMRVLADNIGYSERHLRRLFHASIGVGVKACSRVLRMNRVLPLLEGKTSIARVAQEAGYYDQAHFTNDFKAVCGVSPSTYRQKMAEFYKESLKF